jgi:hypothetical protein
MEEWMRDLDVGDVAGERGDRPASVGRRAGIRHADFSRPAARYCAGEMQRIASSAVEAKRRNEMHAVLTNVTIKDVATAEEYLRDQVVPNVKQAPGFVAGYWMRDEGEGKGVVVFESEDAARQAAERISERVGQNPGVTLNSVTVGEVVAHA